MCIYRIPEIPIHEAGEIMMKGILAEKRIFSVPGYIMPLVDMMK